MSLKIIPLKKQHLEQLRSLYESFGRPKDPWPQEERCDEILAAIHAQGGEVYLAQIDEEIVGTYALYFCSNFSRAGRPFAVVENVVCLKEYRRRGIGKELMLHAQSRAWEKDCYKLILQTGAKRENNHAFYRACGFSPNKIGFEIRREY